MPTTFATFLRFKWLWEQQKRKKMNVTLLHHTPLAVCSTAIRTCWNSHDKSDTVKIKYCAECGIRDINEWNICNYCDSDKIESIFLAGKKDKELIDRVGNKFKHASTLEHLVYTFYIQGVSRALLQELARHRMASLSVKSTRYTLKELKKEPQFLTDRGWAMCDTTDRAEKYLVMTGEEMVDETSIKSLENLRQVLQSGISNDKAKYCLPESYKTELTWTINLRSLQQLLNLRLNKSALWEFQDLCCKIVQALPKEHLYLVEDIVKEQIDGNERIKELVKIFD